MTTDARDVGVLVITTSTQGCRFLRQGFTLTHLGSAAAQRTVYAGGAVYCTDGARALTVRHTAASKLRPPVVVDAGTALLEEQRTPTMMPRTGPAGAFAALSLRSARFSKGRTWPQALVRSYPPASPRNSEVVPARVEGGSTCRFSCLPQQKQVKGAAGDDWTGANSECVPANVLRVENEPSVGAAADILIPKLGLIPLKQKNKTQSSTFPTVTALTCDNSAGSCTSMPEVQSARMFKESVSPSEKPPSISDRCQLHRGAETERCKKSVTTCASYSPLNTVQSAAECSYLFASASVNSPEESRQLPTISSSSKVSTCAGMSFSNASEDGLRQMSPAVTQLPNPAKDTLRLLQDTVLNYLELLFTEFCGTDQSMTSNQFIACMNALHLIKYPGHIAAASSSLFNFLPVDDAIQLYLSVCETHKRDMDFGRFAAAMGYLGEKISKAKKESQGQDKRVFLVLSSLLKIIKRHQFSASTTKSCDLSKVGKISHESAAVGLNFPMLASSKYETEFDGKNAWFQDERPTQFNGNLSVSTWKSQSKLVHVPIKSGF